MPDFPRLPSSSTALRMSTIPIVARPLLVPTCLPPIHLRAQQCLRDTRTRRARVSERTALPRFRSAKARCRAASLPSRASPCRRVSDSTPLPPARAAARGLPPRVSGSTALPPATCAAMRSRLPVYAGVPAPTGDGVRLLCCVVVASREG